MHKRSRLGPDCHVYLFSARFLNMCMPRTTFYLLWQACPPGLAFHGSGLACLLNWLGMMHVGWQMKFIICKWNLSFFKAAPPNRLHSYLGNSLHRISTIFSYFCLFRKAILQRYLKIKFWNFKLIFLRMQFSLAATFFFSSFGYLFELIFAS